MAARAGLDDYRRRRAVRDGTISPVAADLDDDPGTYDSATSLVGVVVYTRTTGDLDDDGNPTYSWATAFSGSAIGYERRTEVHRENAWVRVEGRLVVGDVDGDMAAVTEAATVMITVGDESTVWEVVSVSALPGYADLTLRRYEAVG